jgi:uncharacterized protein
MNKVKLEIVGLSYSQTQSGAYALVLAEAGGKRRLPIIIGGFEAQAIAIELEKMPTHRPLTHDLFKNFAVAFGISISEVVIYNLVEGIFYAKLICQKEGVISEIDARTSDAIALAIRFNAPILTFENILGSAGVLMEDTDPTEDDFDLEEELPEATGYANFSNEEMEEKLAEAIAHEDYELASKLRDELNHRKQS